MVRPINKDTFFLSLKSAPATVMDLPAAQDLRDTLAAHADSCVGMAANMIGTAKRIIIFDNNGVPSVMFNPEILRKTGAYKTEEGCLSLQGVRPVTRYQRIRVRYQDSSFHTKEQVFTGRTAQIIQHEVDHCDGILI